jgi:hypothetical protein
MVAFWVDTFLHVADGAVVTIFAIYTRWYVV